MEIDRVRCDKLVAGNTKLGRMWSSANGPEAAAGLHELKSSGKRKYSLTAAGKNVSEPSQRVKRIAEYVYRKLQIHKDLWIFQTGGQLHGAWHCFGEKLGAAT